MSQTAVWLEVHHYGGQVTEYGRATYVRSGDRIEVRTDDGEFEHPDVWTIVAEMPRS